MGGPIFETVSKAPSNLETPLGPLSDTVQKVTSIACYDFLTGNLLNCDFDTTIIQLHQPTADVENNGGHTHNFDTHPLGTIQVVAPITTAPSTFQSGNTNFDTYFVSHEMPEASGKIDTVLNLHVPPSPPDWHTVSPESCDASRTFWCFFTTIDVGLSGLLAMPSGVPSIVKVRSPDTAHTDAVAFSGKADAIFYLVQIADTYNQLTNGSRLSINDMSLLKGGVFDLNKDFDSPHILHRTGQSVDINKTLGDCRANYQLRRAVNMVLPAEPGSFFDQRMYPSQGHFLCEKNGNIHIDLDITAPPSPPPFE